MNQVLTLILLTLFSSCSSNPLDFGDDSNVTEEQNNNLIKDFEKDDNDLQKFKEQVIVKTVKKETKEKKSKISKKSIKSSKKIIKEKKLFPKNLKKVSENKSKKTKVSKYPKYPKDYPKSYEKTNDSVTKIWESLTVHAYPGEQVQMDINYMGVSTGKIVIKTKSPKKIAGKEVHHISARAKTATFYSYLYELDDKINSYVNKENFTPVKYSIIQEESSQYVNELQLFDHEKYSTYVLYKRIDKKKDKEKKWKKGASSLRFFADPLSILYVLRGLEMTSGKTYTLPIMNKGKIINLKATVVGERTINTKIGSKSSYYIKASTSYRGSTLKSGKMEFWFSTDERRVFLKFKAKINIGSISGDIEKYRR